TKEMLLLDVTPLSLGIEVAGGVTDKVILRNSTVPASATQYYTTQVDGQANVEFRHGLRRESNLGLNHGPADASHRLAVPPSVLPEIESKVAANVVERDRDQQIVDVVSAEMRIAVGRNHLENAVVQLENRDIESAAAEIVDRDNAVCLLVQAVSQRCRRWFVAQPQNIQTRYASGIF